MRRLRILGCSALAALAAGSSALVAAAPPVCPVAAPALPPARRDTQVDQAFGERVADPYRWLEADPHADAAVREWVAEQAGATDAYLKKLPERDAFARTLAALYATERFGLPRKAGDRYFYMHNPGSEQLARLEVRDGLAGKARVLVDPASWGPSRTLEDWAPSHGGRMLAIGTAENGSDWRTIRVIDAGSGQVLPEALEGINDSAIAWVGDEGFLYARYPLSAAERARNAPLRDNAVWYHRAGTPQSADVLVFATPDHPAWVHRVAVTSDARWAVIGTRVGTDPRQQVRLIDLRRRGDRWPIRTLVEDFANDWRLIDGMGNRLWFVTSMGAANNRVLRGDIGAHDIAWTEAVAEGEAMLDRGHVVGNRLVLAYERDGGSFAVITDLAGRPRTSLSLDAIGAASGFTGRPGDSETFFQLSSFARPPAIYRLDLGTGAVEPFALPQAPFNPDDFVVEERRFASRDGTMVPLFVIRNRAAAAANRPLPTLLYGYGGFDVSQTPGYSVPRMAWLLSGGAFALAQVRGGGEFGAAWHEAGRLANKPNAFDDFVAAGEYLVKAGIAAPGGLAAQGASNGGLLVAAAINRRPDLFAAANPQAGVYDMLRFDRFTSGRFWTDEYGHPDREADWRVLRGYSPYHTLRPGTYPALLVSTGDGDDRVVPAHSFKYVAALQANASDARPHLLRVEAGVGHQGARQVDRAISSNADTLAFLACWTGLALPRDGAAALEQAGGPLPPTAPARIGLTTHKLGDASR